MSDEQALVPAGDQGPGTSLAEQHGLTGPEVELIKRTIAEGATDDELALFVKQCNRTGLDPFNRQIHFVKREWTDKRTGADKSKVSIQTGIDGFRLIAERSGSYGGQAPKEWCGADGQWTDVWLSNDPPVAARAGVYRTDWVQPLYAIAHWSELNQDTPVWKQMPALMLGKCAEAAALRAAFPLELSGLYTADEMPEVIDVDSTESLPRGGAMAETQAVNALVKRIECLGDEDRKTCRALRREKGMPMAQADFDELEATVKGYEDAARSGS